jgi:hypothetical protein
MVRRNVPPRAVLPVAEDVFEASAEALAVLLGAAGIDILLHALGLAPLVGGPPRLDTGGLLTGVAPDWHAQDGRVEDLPGSRRQAWLREAVPEAVEQLLGRFQFLDNGSPERQTAAAPGT